MNTNSILENNASGTTIPRIAQTTVARITGACYLAFILTSALAERLGHIGFGTPQQIYQAMTTNPWMFRLALVVGLFSAFLFLASAWGLYVLLLPVNQSLALLFLLLNAVGVAIQCASMLSLMPAVLMGDGASPMQAFSAAQLEGLGVLSAATYKTGFVTAQLFYGTWLFPLGYLAYKSGFLPRFLGVLLLADGVAELIWFFQALLWPAYHAVTYAGTAVSFAAEVGLALWLLVRGVRMGSAAAVRPVEPSRAL